MGSLEDKVLDGPSYGYCSSSDEDEPKTFVIGSDSDSIPTREPGTSRQTGPKGVLVDYKEHKKQQLLNQKDNDQWIRDEAMKMTVKPSAPNVEGEDEDELEQIRRSRLRELKSTSQGKIGELDSKDEFLKVLDGSGPNSLVLIHIYRAGSEACDYLNDILKVCSTKSTNVQYYRIDTDILNTSKTFALKAVPTLQVYVGGDLIGNFIKINEEFSDEYDANDLLNFLRYKSIPIAVESE